MNHQAKRYIRSAKYRALRAAMRRALPSYQPPRDRRPAPHLPNQVVEIIRLRDGHMKFHHHDKTGKWVYGENGQRYSAKLYRVAVELQKIRSKARAKWREKNGLKPGTPGRGMDYYPEVVGV